MNLTDMRTIVRRDLKDEDTGNYRWSSDELDRHIAHAVSDLSEAIPLEQTAILATAAGSRDIDISGLSQRIMLQTIEYPLDKFPRQYQRFSLWANILTLLGDIVPDGSDARIYYGKMHTLDSQTSTIPTHLEGLVASGAEGYAAVEWASYTTNRVNVGGITAPQDFERWGNTRLEYFHKELGRLGRRNHVRLTHLYTPDSPGASKTTDYGS